MKRITIILGALAIVGLSAGIFVMTSCQSNQSDLPTVSVTVMPTSQSGSNQPGTSSRETGVFTSDSPSASAVMSNVAGSTFVQPMLKKFEAMGYSLAPQYSFVMQGMGLPDSAESLGITDSIFVRITTLAMVYNQDTMKRACYVNYADCDYGSFVQPYVLFFGERGEQAPDSSFEWYVGDVWVQYYPVLNPTTVRNIGPTVTAWDWKKWAGCFLGGTVAGCAGTVTRCALAGPAYGQCVAAGCTGSAVVSAIACGVSQVLEDANCQGFDCNGK